MRQTDRQDRQPDFLELVERNTGEETIAMTRPSNETTGVAALGKIGHISEPPIGGSLPRRNA
jgi:hypothetical protein